LIVDELAAAYCSQKLFKLKRINQQQAEGKGEFAGEGAWIRM